MIKAIFWDNDGVLVDTEYLYFRATRQVLLNIGICSTLEKYVDLYLINSIGAFSLVKKMGLDKHKIKSLRKERDEIYFRFIKDKNLILECVRETLDELNGKYMMGIVTGSNENFLYIIHRCTGLLKYFDFFITSDNYKKFKPNPEPYINAVRKCGFKKEECIAIEDSEVGLYSAKKAGIKCLIVPNKLTRKCTFDAATKVLGNIQDVVTEMNNFI